MKHTLTIIQCLLGAYMVFWALHALITLVSYVFTGTTFNPVGLDSDRAQAAYASCIVALLGIGGAAIAKEEM